MPINIELYRPSNGTEGEYFMEAFCAKCVKFEPCPEVGGRHCDIQMRATVHSIGDAKYPTEWRYDENGGPTCTAFEDRNPPTKADKQYLAWKADAS